MTTIEATELLSNWFNQEEGGDNFVLDRDIKKFARVTEDAEGDKAAILSALSDFEKLGLITQQKVVDTTYWVLRRPMITLEQTLVISAPIAATIAKLVNDYCEQTGDLKRIVNPLQIQGKDIVTLCFLLQAAINPEECMCPECQAEKDAEEDTNEDSGGGDEK